MRSMDGPWTTMSDEQIVVNRHMFIKGFLDKIKTIEEFPYLEWYDEAVRRAELMFPFPLTEAVNV